jgi:O-antigen/teichoic acid export membrane protein
VPAIVDLCVCIYLLKSGNGLSSIFFALLISELMKVISSFVIFGLDNRFFIRFGNVNFNISKYINFGKWVWLNNCNIVILNQSDKFLSGSILGMEQLGLYQMGSRISQTATNDVAMAASNYLFPTLSRLNTGKKEEMYKTFCNYFCFIIIYSFVIATSLILLAPLIVVFLGKEWSSSIFLLQILAVSMAIGALVTTLVPLIKAQGAPRLVTKASFIQLLIFLPALFVLGHFYGINGVAFSTIISYSACLGLLITACNIPIKEIIAPLNLFVIPLLIYLCVFILCFFINSIFVTALFVFLNILVCALSCLYIKVSSNYKSN